MTTSLVVLLAALGAPPATPTAAAPAAAPAPATTATAPPPAVEQAKAALQALQKKLQPRLAQAMAAGGPTQAIAVCRDEAPKLTAEAAAETGLRIGRTSDRLRNRADAPPAWAAEAVRAAAGKKAEGVQPAVVDLGSSTGVLLPIPVAANCLGCHGPADGLAPPVKEALRVAYPDDRAVGYAVGDLRGYFWAEVKK